MAGQTITFSMRELVAILSILNDVESFTRAHRIAIDKLARLIELTPEEKEGCNWRESTVVISETETHTLTQFTPGFEVERALSVSQMRQILRHIESPPRTRGWTRSRQPLSDAIIVKLGGDAIGGDE